MSTAHLQEFQRLGTMVVGGALTVQNAPLTDNFKKAAMNVKRMAEIVKDAFQNHPANARDVMEGTFCEEGLPHLCQHALRRANANMRQGRSIDCSRSRGTLTIDGVKTLTTTGDKVRSDAARAATLVHELMHDLEQSRVDDLAWKNCVPSWNRNPHPPAPGAGAPQSEHDEHAKHTSVRNILTSATGMDSALNHMIIYLAIACNFWQLCGMKPPPPPVVGQPKPVIEISADKMEEKKADLDTLCKKFTDACNEFSKEAAKYEMARDAFNMQCPKQGSMDRVVSGVKAKKRSSTVGVGNVNVDAFITEGDQMITEAGKPKAANPTTGAPAVPASGITAEFAAKKADLKCYIK